ncbi:aromatic ring-hydroxylating oxygenase subunit alpha [Glaciimonas immobilis]|uniref:Phenylpropionate dioxygenase-like ring-hydroxylating dioxygenase large terminal subunit n=1 Tax=Glaciimonas immobilis TaxID=728004 RepID=A0A840RR86_9BURK|nr:aromatic ring-hydroxylating dioxygenase subunit alpha [Glaciimonas immobilis]KAF3997374.1 aromatic ring-hydroxylating dioxygenase subunit alpha [Glaciimonas immobilis]MBB5200967.1 phenylpropionate dioxygenase-like ring-hydroxylating dioxygenase large terminal subunit [Glaciimonas immobilis]
MSDLAIVAKLARSEAQLPVNVYFDETLLKREIQQLFQNGPRYVGHELSVPNVGDFATLASENEGRMLVRNPQGITLLSNVCRHRQAKMLDGRGNARNIVCPLHRWTYDLQGELIGAPHFSETPCMNLAQTPLQSWNGLLFEKNGYNVSEKLNQLGVSEDLDFSGYLFDHVEVHECNYNWKTFIEVYLEDYHVEPFHPGLGSFVSCDDLNWEFSKDYSVQTVGVNYGLAKSGSAAYKKWQEQVLKFGNGEPPKFGAIWLTIYPNIMVEWYPHVLVVSTLWPSGPQKTTNVVEFYYPEEVALFEREMVEAERAAYMETCVEDDEIALRMDAGRAILMARGTSEVGPYQSPMEDGMQHFHEWYRNQITLPETAFP